MSYQTHILKDDTYDWLVSLVANFLGLNTLWVTTGEIQYNQQGNYYYQGVITPGNQIAFGGTAALTSATWDATIFYEEVLFTM